MKPVITHPFDISLKQARDIQENLRKKVILRVNKLKPESVAGIDVAFRGNVAYAVCDVFSYPELKLLEESTAIREVLLPYIPGFLSFREIPVIMDALLRIKFEPDVLICDGQGVAHPRGMGLATHIGVLFQKSTIGCAKSRLIGEHEEIGLEKGSMSNLLYMGRVVGCVLRTKTKVKPLFVSPGNLITLGEAVEIITGCIRSRRIPEPVRIADIRSKELKRLS